MVRNMITRQTPFRIEQLSMVINVQPNSPSKCHIAHHNSHITQTPTLMSAILTISMQSNEGAPPANSKFIQSHHTGAPCQICDPGMPSIQLRQNCESDSGFLISQIAPLFGRIDCGRRLPSGNAEYSIVAELRI